MLYDLTSTWLTGRCCELAARGHSRDGKRDDPQIVFGLICAATGCPIAVEVFKGRRPQPHALPTAVWINPPASETATPKTPQPCAVNS